jgi:hypothetical protein
VYLVDYAAWLTGGKYGLAGAFGWRWDGGGDTGPEGGLLHDHVIRRVSSPGLSSRCPSLRASSEAFQSGGDGQGLSGGLAGGRVHAPTFTGSRASGYRLVLRPLLLACSMQRAAPERMCALSDADYAAV